MKLIYKISLSLSIPLVVTLALWSWLSYRTMEKKIHADTDLILRDYSAGLIARRHLFFMVIFVFFAEDI